ncbi:succinyl-diaminopimelate desuccinylase [Lactobacillus colini]|uniref:Succinyl-diaminopimelate desuccinylase n=1 Tax=Lactobacillus colini TaxID=1819254 RepID=A0ABS4MBN9_9LACO|nr:Sapep family Mn(2+)-dependent dipeptidase [Lactobacillus colini]MBP2057097.1 succinyl-diaminopimelate desuccinylase [Lactobacillus colini]
MISEKDIQQAIENSKAQFLGTLRQIMQIKSTKSEPAKDSPFGLGSKEALVAVEKLGEEYGFESKIVNNAMTYIQWGRQDDYFAVVDHLDVVPAGKDIEAWEYNPWDLSQDGNKLYGRGILDNKGPAIATLWGMKLLKDLGFQPKNTIRLIYGSDEESGSHDVPLYLEQEKPPIFGWTADCKYPVVYGERGIVNYTIHTKFDKEDLVKIKKIIGDMAMDHVPDKITLELNAGLEITAHGKRSPSNAPELGKNAITQLAKKIVGHEVLSGDVLSYFKWIKDSLADKHFGQGLGIEFSDEDSGKLIMTPTSLSKDGNELLLDIAIRYPVSYSEEDVTQGIKKHLPTKSKLTISRSISSVMHNKNSKYIKMLSDVYSACTKLDSTPVTTTGATYARVMPNIIAFGPSFPGQKGIAHKENEWMNIDDLFLNMKIYMMALMKLGNA